MTDRPAPPAHVEPYVQILGEDLAIAFLMEFGGAERYVPRSPDNRADIEAVIGPEGANALAAAQTRLPRRHPVAKRWIAQVLSARGLPINKIAPKLHVTDTTVRSYLKVGAPKRPPPSIQPDLFD
jgi:hypothetical protein